MQVKHLTKSDFLSGDSSPLNKVTPSFVGQMYIQQMRIIYIATHLTSNSWIPLQSLLSEVEGVENIGESILALIQDVEKLKPLVNQVKGINTDIDNLGTTIDSKPSVSDIHNVLEEVFNLKDYYTKKPIDNKFLGYDTLIDDLQRRMDAIELKVTVGCMGITAPKEITLSSNDPVALPITLAPYNTTDLLEFTSTNANIVTVDRGLITPKGVNGSAVIKMTCGSRKAECIVNVAIEETVEVVDNLISTSEELHVVNGYITAPIVSTINKDIQIKYLVWELVHDDKIVSVGTFQENEKLLNKILFNCEYLNPQKDYTGTKIVAKKYDPSTGTFKVVGNSHDIIIRF